MSPISLHITGGEASHCPQFATLIGIGPDTKPRAIVADKGYSCGANRALACTGGIVPINPHKSKENIQPKHVAKALHKGRSRIERALGWLKRFKRGTLLWETTA